eukprot:GCRY01002518.1.p1 GENE.GCRY01002518.1~~GCRY01002518.1.p1  ORF type:complete len:977 (-),score=194.24 GCRY01002518.1:401-3331(-)
MSVAMSYPIPDLTLCLATSEGAEIQKDVDGQFVLFTLKIRDIVNGWLIRRRYSDFYRLKMKLKKTHPEFSFPFPKKRLRRSSLLPAICEERKEGLRNFLNSALQLCDSDDLRLFVTHKMSSIVPRKLMSVPSSRMEGILWKKNRRVSNWVTRFCVVANCNFYTFKEKDERTPHLAVPLEDCTCTQVQNEFSDNCLLLSWPEGEVLLAATSEEEKTMWLQCIESHIWPAPRGYGSPGEYSTVFAGEKDIVNVSDAEGDDTLSVSLSQSQGRRWGSTGPAWPSLGAEDAGVAAEGANPHAPSWVKGDDDQMVCSIFCRSMSPGSPTAAVQSTASTNTATGRLGSPPSAHSSSSSSRFLSPTAPQSVSARGFSPSSPLVFAKRAFKSLRRKGTSKEESDRNVIDNASMQTERTEYADSDEELESEEERDPTESNNDTGFDSFADHDDVGMVDSLNANGLRIPSLWQRKTTNTVVDFIKTLKRRSTHLKDGVGPKDPCSPAARPGNMPNAAGSERRGSGECGEIGEDGEYRTRRGSIKRKHADSCGSCDGRSSSPTVTKHPRNAHTEKHSGGDWIAVGAEDTLMNPYSGFSKKEKKLQEKERASKQGATPSSPMMAFQTRPRADRGSPPALDPAPEITVTPEPCESAEFHLSLSTPQPHLSLSTPQPHLRPPAGTYTQNPASDPNNEQQQHSSAAPYYSTMSQMQGIGMSLDPAGGNTSSYSGISGGLGAALSTCPHGALGVDVGDPGSSEWAISMACPSASSFFAASADHSWHNRPSSASNAVPLPTSPSFELSLEALEQIDLLPDQPSGCGLLVGSLPASPSMDLAILGSHPSFGRGRALLGSNLSLDNLSVADIPLNDPNEFSASPKGTEQFTTAALSELYSLSGPTLSHPLALPSTTSASSALSGMAAADESEAEPRAHPAPNGPKVQPRGSDYEWTQSTGSGRSAAGGDFPNDAHAAITYQSSAFHELTPPSLLQ